MEKNYIKRIAMILTVFVTLTLFGSFTLGTDNATESDVERNTANEELVDLGNIEANEEQELSNGKTEDNTNESIEDAKLNDASDKILSNVTKTERKKAYYIDKYNDEFLGQVAFALDVVRLYSLPICFIGITIGAFNFLIMGNKKLDKKEQGFGWIVGFTIGLVVFNVLPLLYALLVAGR
ncbi:MAG: hypothetical protein IJX99_07680 [Clostridia bacterium]|nr:hypothetical protein [Clostridia bacterium]